MKTASSILIACVLVLSGCSKNEAPATAPAANTAATPPAAPPPEEPAVLSEELKARLVRPHSPVLGPAQAPVTIVEFLDPACEACRAYAPVVKQILFLYPTEVRVVVRFADFHEGSDEAIRLIEASRRQGKFEQVLGALFDGQDQWASHHRPNLEEAWKIAAANGVDVARARREGASPSVDAILTQEAEDIVALQVQRTPTFFVNGKPLTVFGAEPLMQLVAEEVKAAAGAKPAN
jgi:protein-disulfide isomerase